MMTPTVKALVDVYTTQLVLSGRVREAEQLRLSVNALGKSAQTEKNVLRVLRNHDQGIAM